MKSIELFCASPASTAICSSMDHRAIVRPGTRPADRRVHRLGEKPKNRTNSGRCLSQLPFDPSRRSYHKSRKNHNSSAKQTEVSRRNSSADVDDLASASRYLLSDQPFLDDIVVSDRALVSSQVLTGNVIGKYKRLDLDGFRSLRSFSAQPYEDYPVYKPSSTSARNPLGKLCSDDDDDDDTNARKSMSNRQVVELRVSIHCKGCEGKLRKYISRMEGVTSFSIDLATKKVTVIGDVTPLGVLASVSKVKNAQFWASPSTSSSSSSLSSPRVSLTR